MWKIFKAESSFSPSWILCWNPRGSQNSYKVRRKRKEKKLKRYIIQRASMKDKSQLFCCCWFWFFHAALHGLRARKGKETRRTQGRRAPAPKWSRGGVRGKGREGRKFHDSYRSEGQGAVTPALVNRRHHCAMKKGKPPHTQRKSWHHGIFDNI